MYPEDRVLVGVINRKRDLDLLLAEHWYRIPQGRMPRGVHTEYLSFFLSGAAAPRTSLDASSTPSEPAKRTSLPGIHWFAEYRGVELVYRHQLLPKEADHPRANEVYYKIQVGELRAKTPPILNPTRRSLTFIYTTWDRFLLAQTIPDLYSTADFFVDRVYTALESRGVRPSRFWAAEKKDNPFAPGFGVLCERGEVSFSTDPQSGAYWLDPAKTQDAILREILDEITRNGGPVTLSLSI
ncbi:MAG: hypothetical protein U0670_20755 [Anaerolineae bacterium]